MYKKIIMIIAVMLFGCLNFNALAENFDNQGTVHEVDNRKYDKEATGSFSGTVHVGGFWMNSKNHLSPGDKNKRLDNLNQTAKNETEVIPFVFFNINYDFENGNQIYMSIPFEDEPRLTFGAQHGMGNAGNLDLSVFFMLPEEVWKDPYLTGVDRKKTDKTVYGGKLEYSLNHFNVSYELGCVDVNKDEIGARFKNLRRNGNIHQIETGYKIELKNGFILEPGIGYVMANMDGKSNQYKGHKGGLTMIKKYNNFSIHAFVGGELNDYDTVNPIFNTTREDKKFESMVGLSWVNPLGYDRCSLDIGGGYEKNDSTIVFYDSEGYFSFITLGYHF